jgi:hypothetical protein
MGMFGIRLRSIRAAFTVAIAGAVVLPLALPSGVAHAAQPNKDWQVAVSRIPTTRYVKDARATLGDTSTALRAYLADPQGIEKLDDVSADVDTRYFDGARLLGEADADPSFDHLQRLDSYLKSRLEGNKLPVGAARTAHIDALVGALTASRMAADTAIQDVEAAVRPFTVGYCDGSKPPGPAGLSAALGELKDAKEDFAKADKELEKGQPEPAAEHAEHAWKHAFSALGKLGITYGGDLDGDGVVDVVELRFGASPLVADSDGDTLTDRFEIVELAGWSPAEQL